MKNITLLSVGIVMTLFSLTACFNSNSAVNTGTVSTYQGTSFTIDYPNNWDVFDEKDLSSNAPEGTLVVFRSAEALNGTFNNISVVREEVPEDMDSITYAQMNIENTPASLKNFQSITKNKVTVNNKETILFNFSGRNTDTAKDNQYFQVYLTNGKYGYTITGVMPFDATDEYKNQITSSLQSFSFK